MNHFLTESVTRAIERAKQRLQAIETSHDDTRTRRLKADSTILFLLEDVAEMLPPEQQDGVKACIALNTRIWKP